MPSLPSDGTPMVTHLPSLPSTQSWMWSMAALAAETAEDRQRASLIAAPRLPTVGMEGSGIHAAALIFCFTGSHLMSVEGSVGMVVVNLCRLSLSTLPLNTTRKRLN